MAKSTQTGKHQEAEINNHPPVPSHPLHWFPEFWELGINVSAPKPVCWDCRLLVGIIYAAWRNCLFTARDSFTLALQCVVGYHAGVPGGEPPLLAETARSFHPLLLLVVLTLGGILSGIIVFTLAPEAEGHGTDAAIAAYHYHNGHIRGRVPLVKMVASAITLGSGGSGGREGPIA